MALSPAARPAALAAGLTAAFTAALALRDTRVHLVPVEGGYWRALADPPSAARWAVSAIIALAVVGLLRARGRAAAWPLLALLLAAAPLLPLMIGRGTALLLFQGPVITMVAVMAACAAFVSAFGTTSPRLPAWSLGGAALLFYVLLGTHLPGAPGPQGDEPHYLTMAQSLASDGDLDLTDEFAAREYASFYAGTLEPHASPASPRGRVLPLHAPGLPVLLLPGYVLGGFRGAQLVMSVVAALTTLLVFLLVRDVTGSGRLALGAWAVVTLAPPLPLYAVSLYPETPAALGTAVLLLATRRDPGRALLLAATMVAAALPWLHPKFLPLTVVGMVLVLARRGQPWPRIAAGTVVAASVAALLLYFRGMYGTLSLGAAYGPGLASDVSLLRLPLGTAGLLFDRQFGLLPMSPVWLLAAPGLVMLWRHRTGDSARALLLAGATFGVGASFSMWWGGACPPARFVVPAVPALAVLLAAGMRDRPRTSAALAGFGLAVVLLAMDAPRVLHNRADGVTGLWRHAAPTLALDARLPSFATHAANGAVLVVSALAAAAAAWRLRWAGLAAGVLGYGLVAHGLTPVSFVERRSATVAWLQAWDPALVWTASGDRGPGPVFLPLELPSAPWTIGERDVFLSRRLDLPPGAYRLHVDGSSDGVQPGARATRLELTTGDQVLALCYLQQGQDGAGAAFVVPTAARRVSLTAAGLKGRGELRAAWIVPQALVPRSSRGAFEWPRESRDDTWRAGGGVVRTTAIDRVTTEAAGFRLEGETARFVVEVPTGATARVRLDAVAGSARLTWGTSAPLPGPLATELPAAAGVALGDVSLVPVRVEGAGAVIAFDDVSGEAQRR